MADLQIHANLAIAAGAVFIPVCTACVGLRVYARRLRGVNLGADDWTVIVAMVSNLESVRLLSLIRQIFLVAQGFVIAMGVTLIAGKSTVWAAKTCC